MVPGAYHPTDPESPAFRQVDELAEGSQRQRLFCPRCGELVRIIACVTKGGPIQRILASRDEPTQSPPRITPAARAPSWQEYFDPCEVDALTMSESVSAYEFDQRVNW